MQIVEGSSKLKEDVITHYLMYADTQSAAKFIIDQQLYSSSACSHPEIMPLLPVPYRPQCQNIVVEESWDDDDVDMGNNQQETAPNAEAGVEATVPRNVSIDLIPEDFDLDAEEEGQKLPLYHYPIPESNVHLIAEASEVMTFCRMIDNAPCNYHSASRNVVMSGFDSEWKPMMSKTSGAAILQLAFKSDIYIFDIVALKMESAGDSAHWVALRKSYFENEVTYILTKCKAKLVDFPQEAIISLYEICNWQFQKIFKLGFDVKNDVKMLTDTTPEWNGMNKTWKAVVDLQSIKSSILMEDPKFFSHFGTSSSRFQQFEYEIGNFL